jgi:hypothetical protein
LGRLAGGCGVDSPGSGYGPVVGSCECGDEPSGSEAMELVILIILRNKYKSRSSLLCNFLHPPDTSSLLGPNTFVSSLLGPNTLLMLVFWVMTPCGLVGFNIFTTMKSRTSLTVCSRSSGQWIVFHIHTKQHLW